VAPPNDLPGEKGKNNRLPLPMKWAFAAEIMHWHGRLSVIAPARSSLILLVLRVDGGSSLPA